ncbi:MAG: ABC transporter ATP-binding protein, partial [Chitinophagaceae bacterium]|nr:ABC transporter ATP-binding protein [Chitinophagaceae bacterium]
MQPLLHIQNLSVDFTLENEIIHAVKNVSLTVNRGEIVAIVGESGSGKSVTSLSVLQLLPSPPAKYTDGRILFYNGEVPMDLLHINKQELQQIRGGEIAMIFQEPMSSLNPVFSCGDQVKEALLQHKRFSEQQAKQQAIEWFKKVRLPEAEKIFYRYPHQLSGGQKQRVMIAMAMCCHPSLLMCDEPTTALDVTVQKTILELIKDLQREENMGVIFVTHDLGVVAELAHRVAIMYKGEIVEQNTVHEIFTRPQNAYTKALIACRPAIHPKGERLPVVSDFLQKEQKAAPAKPSAQEVQINDQKIRKEVLVDVQHVSVLFPTRANLFGRAKHFTTAVDDVSFQIYKGETLGLVGESGCGKTTLGRTLLRLIEPTSGKIFFSNAEITAFEKKKLKQLRKQAQLLFQDPYSSLNPRIAIGYAIEEPVRILGREKSAKQRKEKVAELLQKVNLPPEFAARYPHEFSGGQRQRIVIARALAVNPDFIVCDESVSALDVSVQAQVLNLLNELKQDLGLTMLFISHDLSVV